MIRIIAIIILISIPVIIAISYAMDKTTITAEEEQQIIIACLDCHGADPHSDNGDDDDEDGYNMFLDAPAREKCFRCHDDFHKVHSSADCIKCHTGATGLESADRAHDTFQWVGIGIMAAVVAGLGVNFTVARKRLKGD